MARNDVFGPSQRGIAAAMAAELNMRLDPRRVRTSGASLATKLATGY